MANTYKLITSTTVGSGGSASVTLSNIPQTYSDLRILVSARTSSSGNYFTILPNGSSANGSNKRIYGNGSTIASYSGSEIFSYVGFASQNGNTFGNAEIYIPKYTGSNNKAFSIEAISEHNDTNAEASLIAGLWSSSSAITSIQFTPSTGTFIQNSTFHLYGIKNS